MKTMLFALSLLVSFAAMPARSGSVLSSPSAPVYVIPIRGQIEGALLYVIRRGLAEAGRHNASAVLLLMDTPGGTLSAASDIVRSIQASSIPVHTYVEKQALSAGAIIALSTKTIHMAPGSVIGDALPIMMSPFGGIQEMSDGVEEKAVSAVSALIRSAAQAAGHDPELAEKMVRRESEFKVGDDVLSPSGQLLTLTAEEAARPGPREGKPLLSSGTVPDLPSLLETLGLEGLELVEMEITASERIARLVAAAAPILMMLGMLGIYIEFRTPGIGLPGILGALCLVLFFWGHHIAGLAGMEDLILFLVGVLLILAEIFVIPGFGIAGILGIALVFFSLVGAMTRMVPGSPWTFVWPDLRFSFMKAGVGLVLSGLGILLLGRYLPRSRWFGRMALSATTSAAAGYTAAPDGSAWVGKTGVAISSLRPSGTALVDGERIDVVTAGEFIEAGDPIRIAEAHGSRLVAERRPSNA